MPNQLGRRDFIKWTALAGAGILASSTLPSISHATYARTSLSDCLDMPPQDMAEASDIVRSSWKYIREAAASIGNPALRARVENILDNPAPTLLRRIGKAEKKNLHAEFTAKGMLKNVAENDFLPPAASPDKAPQPFLSAPGSGYASHHSYPGGLVTHTALNVKSSLAIYEGYREIYDYLLDRDVVIASQILHDLHKPWVFQWGEDGESRTELSLAGTGEHHTLGVAESISRGLPAEVCVAQACAHNHPGFDKDEAEVVGWITAAAMLNGVNPVKAGLLGEGGKTLPQPRRMEGFVCHLGDHDWVLSVPAAKWLIPAMGKIAVTRYGMHEADLKGRKFNALRNYVFSQATIMGLYQLYATEGEESLTRTVLSMVRPA
ncbi:MAG: twin-arginine translocation signal domain-containing protein [Desulfocurvibacter africanus]